MAKIGMVTASYPSKHCGISTYTGHLESELRDLIEIDMIIAPRQVGDRAYIQQIVEHASEYALIHVQHAFDLYGYMGLNTLNLYAALRKTGVPVITTLHELPPFPPVRLKDRVANLYFRVCIDQIANASRLIFVHSQHGLNLLSTWGAAEKSVILPHGTVLPNRLPRTDVTVNKPPVIGFVGFIHPNKGIERLIRVLPDLPDVRLIIGGEPKGDGAEHYLEHLKEFAQRLGLHDQVSFAGYVPDERLADFFGQLDVAVFPYEQVTASGILHLAIGHQVVCLTSNLPAFQELQQNYDCLEMFRREVPQDLETKLKFILKDMGRRRALVEGCRRMIEITNWRNIAHTTLGYYRRIQGQ